MSDIETIPFITLINSFTEVSEINRKQIISKFDLLEESKKTKINELAQPLIDSDKQLLNLLENPFVSEKLTESGLINSIRTFQFNILFDYINKAIPDCNHEINQIYIIFRKQFDELNQLYIKKLNKKLYTMDGIYIDPDLNVDEKLKKIHRFTNDMVKIINETININEFTTPEQFKRELFQNNIRKIVSILNSNIFLKVLSILSTFRNASDEIREGGGASEGKGAEDGSEGAEVSEKEYISELETIITNLSGGADGSGIIDFNNMIEDFFITWDEIDTKDIHMIKIIDYLKLQKYVDRDTFIYNKHFPDSRKKAIFLFTFVNSITYAESYIIENIIRDEILPVIIIQLIKNISNKLYNYIQYSEMFHIKRKQITELYNKINKSYKHIFSYVKLNKYDETENKRVQILPLENNSIIKMNYKNTDKINSEIIDSDTKDEETYYFGRFDKVFDNSITYSEISDTIHSDIEQRINNFEDVCIIGYGQSGSGKTTTLLRGMGEQNGVLTNLLEKISPNNIKVKIIELVVDPNDKPEDKSQVNTKYYKKDLIQLAETIEKLPEIGTSNSGFSTNARGELSENKDSEFIINNTISTRNILKIREGISTTRTQYYKTKDNDYESIYDKKFNKRISSYDDNRSTTTIKATEYITYDKNNTIKYFMEGQPYIFYTKTKDNFIKYENSPGGAITNLVKVNLSKDRNQRGLLGLKNNISEFNHIENSNITEIISGIENTIKYRLERPTSNNSNSSRSHLFIDFEITKGSNNFHIILCDFAGVENEFDCDTVDIKNKFFKAYKDTVISIPSTKVIKDELNKITQGKSSTINKNCSNLLEKSSLDKITQKNNCKKDMETRIKILCEERKKEGYLINKTLSDLRFDISNFVKTIISSNNTSSFLPIFTDNDIYPYCRNVNINENYFETFYDYKADEVEPKGLINQIFREILGEEKYKKLIIILFTVILLNVKTGAGDSKKDYNNPPSIPYININKLIYYKETNASSDKLISEYRKIKNNMKKFNFYKKDSDIIDEDVGAAGGAGGAGGAAEFKDSDSVSSIESTDEDILEKIPAFIKKIKENNASTLVGSLETASMLQNLTFNKFTCFKEEIKNEDDTFIDDTINTLDSYGYKLNLDYSKKYLKYKKKYLLLRSKSN